MAQRRYELVFKSVAWPSRSSAEGASTLNHEVSDDSMKGEPIEVTPSGEIDKISDGNGGFLRIKVKANIAFVRFNRGSDAHRDPFEIGVDWLRKYSSGVSINPRLVPRLGKRGSAGEAQGPFRLLAPNCAVFNFLDLIDKELHLGWLHQERSGSILAGFLRLKI